MKNLISVLVAFACLTWPAASDASIEGWELRNAALNDMAYGGGVYVAVGVNGFILRSKDGDNWVQIPSGVDDELFAVAYGDTNFVAIGGGTVLTSPDGLEWTEQDPAVSVYGYDLVYGEGTFVAVGSGSDVYLSPDGVDWTSYDSGAPNLPTAITYGNGLFVITGYGGMILTSDNGSSGWTTRNSTVGITFWDADYTGAGFIAVGTSGTAVTSADGISWATTSSGFTQTMMAVGYGGGQFVTTGSNSSSDTGHVWTSPDGDAWTDHDSGFHEFMYDVEAVGSRYFITGGKIIVSDNGVDWNVAHDATGWSIQSLAYGDGVYVAGYQFGTSIKSADGGLTWSGMTSAHDSDITGIDYDADLESFIGVCSSGQVLSASPMDDSWTSTVHSVGFGLNDVTWDPATGDHIMVGYSGTIATLSSSDVLSTVPPLTLYTLRGVAVAGSTYVAVGDNGTIITSLDAGASWQTTTPATAETLLDVAHGNGVWLAGGYFGTLLTSPDGINWTDISGSFGHLYGMTFGDGRFVAHGGSGTLMSSTNGTDWEEYHVSSSYLPAGVFADGRFTIAGGDGVILQSVPGGGGGGSGGCSTAAFPEDEPVWPEVFWILLLGAFIWRMRVRVRR